MRSMHLAQWTSQQTRLAATWHTSHPDHIPLIPVPYGSAAGPPDIWKSSPTWAHFRLFPNRRTKFSSCYQTGYIRHFPKRATGLNSSRPPILSFNSKHKCGTRHTSPTLASNKPFRTSLLSSNQIDPDATSIHRFKWFLHFTLKVLFHSFLFHCLLPTQPGNQQNCLCSQSPSLSFKHGERLSHPVTVYGIHMVLHVPHDATELNWLAGLSMHQPNRPLIGTKPFLSQPHVNLMSYACKHPLSSLWKPVTEGVIPGPFFHEELPYN